MVDSSFVTTPCAWVSLLTFIACIACVIINPKVPIFFHWRRIHKYVESKRAKNPVPVSQTELPELTTDTNIIIERALETSPQDPMFHWLTLDMASAPIISLLFLFATTCLSWDEFISGIVGDDKIRPYGVIVLFMSLSYVCISLDITGLFEYFAKIIIIKSKGRGHHLFIFFALFASILTLFTSNDIVILTLTPICCYLAKNAKNLDLIPFVICQFFLANIWSVAFQIGNPTNMIVAEAYKMNFLNYFLWMGLPAIVAGTSSFIILYGIFYKKIPSVIISENIDENTSLQSKKSAIVKSIGLFLCLFVLAIVSVIPLPNGMTIPAFFVCLVFFILFFVFDVVMDCIYLKTNEESFKNKVKLLNVTKVGQRMPWSIVPFVFGMFVMVELLNYYGFVTLVATVLNSIITGISSIKSDSLFLNVASTCYLISIISTVACNLLNNQPMTILFTKVLTNDAYLTDAVLQKASSLTLILGSNLGANVTLIGALAGIMWIKILRDYGVESKDMNYFKFLMYGIIVTPVALLLATTVIVLEVYIVNRT